VRLGRTGTGTLIVVDGEEAVEVSSLFADVADDWAGVFAAAATDRLRTLPDGLPRSPLAETSLGAPLARPGKIVAAPVNYRSHQDEMSWPTTVEDLGVFLKAPSSLIGPGEEVRLPYSDVRTDQEGELAVVIGRRARNVSPEAAISYVAGYTCLLDITVRSSEDRSARKSFDTFTPVGPWIASPDEVGDPDRLELRCWVGGELRQAVNTDHLIFSVPLLIAYASSVMTLEPGDLLATGTPDGVGPLADGDVVAVEIERVGRLEVTVSARKAVPYATRPSLALVGGDERIDNEGSST
jgi:2-keto-4-pentenoate hydratase/2-oxohepta-3-ene-1,7-dioic acid hydratase in catechol pathway